LQDQRDEWRKKYDFMVIDRNNWEKSWRVLEATYREETAELKKKYDFIKMDRDNWRKRLEIHSTIEDHDKIVGGKSVQDIVRELKLMEDVFKERAQSSFQTESEKNWMRTFRDNLKKIQELLLLNGTQKSTNACSKDALFRGHFVVNVDVFSRDVLFLINLSREQIAEVIDKYEGLEGYDKEEQPSFEDGNFFATTYETTTGPLIVRFRSWDTSIKQMATLAHEIFHVAELILHKIEVRHDIYNTSEVYAYLVDYLTKRVYENLRLTISQDGL
jgi:hypothetical protein